MSDRIQTLTEIRSCVQQAVDFFEPQKIILFGSYAYGTPHRDSDVDLLFILAHIQSPIEMASQIRLKLPSVFSFDVLVRTHEKIKERFLAGDNFISEILEKGITLYEAKYNGMD